MKCLAGCVAAAVLAVVLAGCASAPPQGYRDINANIASQVNVTAARMAGSWVIRQAAGGTGANRLAIVARPDGGLDITRSASPCANTPCANTATFVPSGSGRWTPTGPQSVIPDAEIWVMWMDYDGRTAAIGTPGGAFGWIIDQNATGGDDRIIAARDIMAWFGYDLTSVGPAASE